VTSATPAKTATPASTATTGPTEIAPESRDSASLAGPDAPARRWDESPWIDAWLATLAVGLALAAFLLQEPPRSLWPELAVSTTPTETATENGIAADATLRIGDDNRLDYQSHTLTDPARLAVYWSGNPPSRVRVVVSPAALQETVIRTVEALGQLGVRQVQLESLESVR